MDYLRLVQWTNKNKTYKSIRKKDRQTVTETDRQTETDWYLSRQITDKDRVEVSIIYSKEVALTKDL